MKMRKRGNIRLVIFPDEKSNPRNFSFRWSTVYVLGTIMGLFLMLFVWESVTYFRMVKIAFEYNKLKSEYNILIGQLDKVNKLEQKFQQLKSYEQKIKSVLGTYLSLTAGDTASIQDFWETSQNMTTIFENVPGFTPVNGYLSREFEPNSHPGIDIAAASGTPVKAVAGGRVLFSGWNPKFGNVIIIYHGNGYFSIYKHNLRNVVTENQIVSKGQLIAYVGESGQLSSGPHLHLEIWQKNTPLDPLIFLSIRKN